MMPSELNKRSKVDLNTIGGRIQFRRITNGWSRAQLGARMNMSASTVSGHERNEGGFKTRPDTIRRFAIALGCKPAEIDPNFRETIEFRRNPDGLYLIVNGYNDTLTAFGLDRSERYNHEMFMRHVAILSKAGFDVTIHPTD